MQGLRGRVAAHPTTSFFVLAFAISWVLWTPGMIAGGLEGAVVAPFFIGVFGPAAAAAIVVRAGGSSVRTWLRRIFKVRVPARYYAAAIGYPVALAITASAGFAAAGESLDFGLAGERAASLLPVFVFCLLLNGGPEEFGWRGFALPSLQERFSPVRSTLILGVLWGLWHLPLLRLEDNAGHDLATLPLIAMLVWTLAGFVAYAFTYTYAWNRTGSVVICIVLHAAYNTANGLLILRPEDELVGDAYVILSLVLTGLLWLTAWALVRRTGGRLGLPDAPRGEASPAVSPAAPAATGTPRSV